MNAATPLIGTIILCLALVVNFFRAAWRLGILRAFGRRKPLTWRPLIAGIFAAFLPISGAMAAMVIIPPETQEQLIPITAGELAFQLALAGLLMHLINDKIMHWGNRNKSGQR